MADGNTFMQMIRTDPFGFFAMARRGGPVMFSDNVASWNVFGYAETMEVLRNPAVYSSDVARYAAGSSEVPPRSLLALDPPRHTQLRSLVNAAFTMRRVAALDLNQAIVECCVTYNCADEECGDTPGLQVCPFSPCYGAYC